MDYMFYTGSSSLERLNVKPKLDLTDGARLRRRSSANIRPNSGVIRRISGKLSIPLVLNFVGVN